MFHTVIQKIKVARFLLRHTVHAQSETDRYTDGQITIC